MAIKRSAHKEIRKSKSRHFKNVSTKTELKSMVKKFNKCIDEKKADEAKNTLNTIISKLDKAASKNIIKKNTASRKISRLMIKMGKLSA